MSIPGHKHFHAKPRRIKTYVVFLFEKLQVGNLVASEIVHDLVCRQELRDPAGLLLILLQLGDDLLPPLSILSRRLVQVLDLAVQVGGVVGHVGLLEQLVLGLGDLARLLLVLDVAILIFQLVGRELQQREDQVAVES